jgi:hypothetical protein
VRMAEWARQGEARTSVPYFAVAGDRGHWRPSSPSQSGPRGSSACETLAAVALIPFAIGYMVAKPEQAARDMVG